MGKKPKATARDLATDLWRVYGGAAADTLGTPADLLYPPINAGLKKLGVKYQLPVGTIAGTVPEPTGLANKVARFGAGFLVPGAPAAKGAKGAKLAKEVAGEAEKLAAKYGTDVPNVRVDNPGGEWLASKQRYAEEDMVKAAKAGYAPGAPRGPVTGYLDKPMLLDPAKVGKIPGAMGEVPKPGNPKYDALMKSMSKKGYDPEQGGAILVGVNHRGEPHIIEGNNRAAVARDIGLPAIPAEVRWYAGGEQVPGALSPDKLADYVYKPPAAQELGAKYGLPEFTTDLTPAQIEANKAAFLADSKAPPVLYHGTQVWEHEGRQLGDIEHFNRNASVDIVKRKPGFDTVGVWMDESPASTHGAGMYAGNTGAVYPLHARITNPWVPKDFREFRNLAEKDPEGFRKQLMSDGFDGIVFPAGEVDNAKQGPVWVALDPSQVKSTLNRGTFDPKEPHLSKARGGLAKKYGV